jgi:hypothetical protein
MNQETLLRANAQLYGTLTIIGGVLDGYVDHEMDNGRQPAANLGVAAGLATKILNDVEKLFDEAAAPEFEVVHPDEFTFNRDDEREAAAARMGDAIRRGADADLNERMAHFTGLGQVFHVAAKFSHPFATRGYCKLCGDS